MFWGPETAFVFLARLCIVSRGLIVGTTCTMNGTRPGDSHEALMPGGPPLPWISSLMAALRPSCPAVNLISGILSLATALERLSCPAASLLSLSVDQTSLFVTRGGLPLGQATAVGVSYLAHTPSGQHASLASSLGQGLTAPLPGSHLPFPRLSE